MHTMRDGVAGAPLVRARGGVGMEVAGWKGNRSLSQNIVRLLMRPTLGFSPEDDTNAEEDVPHPAGAFLRSGGYGTAGET